MNKIILTVDAPCSAVLSSSEVMYPGWRASVDGKEEHIMEGNLAFRALSVSAGKHTVTMWYDPSIFAIGAAVSIGTAMLCLLLTQLEKRTPTGRLFQWLKQRV